MSVNKCILVGRLGSDPEIRRTQDGRAIASFSFATSESWKDKNTGERREETEWHRIVVFNEGLCRVIEQYVKKGSQLYIEGKSKTRKYTDTSGIERKVTEIVVQGFGGTIQMVGSSGKTPSASDPSDYGAEPDDHIPY